jgi:ubiquinone/menaquinone biosynthesis C-methylase UbiE
MYREVLNQVPLSNESVLLDAGCGAGLFSSIAIKSGAHVIGIDAAYGLLEIARKRNPKNNFLEEDLEDLPFADESFSVVAGFNSFQYAGSFENALLEAKRVLKQNGRIVLGIWDKPGNSDATQILKAIGTLLPPPPPGTPGPFALSEDGKMENIFKSNGLKLLSKTVVACPILYRNIEDGIKSFMSTGPAASAMKFAEKTKVEQTIAEALTAFELADGLHFLQNHFLVFVVTK